MHAYKNDTQVYYSELSCNTVSTFEKVLRPSKKKFYQIRVEIDFESIDGVAVF